MKTAFIQRPRKRDGATGIKRAGTTRGLVVCYVAVTVSIVGGYGGIPPIALAQTRPMVMAGVMAGLTERGIVTDLSEQTIVIDGRAYEVDQHVEVFDDEGHQVDLSAVTRSAEVRFRVKRDNTHKIDKIMVYLAR